MWYRYYSRYGQQTQTVNKHSRENAKKTRCNLKLSSSLISSLARSTDAMADTEIWQFFLITIHPDSLCCKWRSRPRNEYPNVNISLGGKHRIQPANVLSLLIITGPRSVRRWKNGWLKHMYHSFFFFFFGLVWFCLGSVGFVVFWFLKFKLMPRNKGSTGKRGKSNRATFDVDECRLDTTLPSKVNICNR